MIQIDTNVSAILSPLNFSYEKLVFRYFEGGYPWRKRSLDWYDEVGLPLLENMLSTLLLNSSDRYIADGHACSVLEVSYLYSSQFLIVCTPPALPGNHFKRSSSEQ